MTPTEESQRIKDLFSKLILFISQGDRIYDFYSIGINVTGINLQGLYETDKVHKYSRLGFVFSLSDQSKFIDGKMGEINITLT